MVNVLCYIIMLCKVEGVGSDGRMFLLERPTNEAVQSQLWALYLSAEDKKNELKSRLKFKVSECVVLSLCVMFVVMCCVRWSN